MLKTLMDRIAVEYKKARQEADARLLQLYESDGATSRTVMVDGRRVAKLGVSATDPSIGVDDEALLEWVSARHPTEVFEETIHVIRGAFRSALMARLQIAGERVVDTETGEVVPWAKVVPGGPRSVALTWDKGGREHVAAAWNDGLFAGQLAIGGTA